MQIESKRFQNTKNFFYLKKSQSVIGLTLR